MEHSTGGIRNSLSLSERKHENNNSPLVVRAERFAKPHPKHLDALVHLLLISSGCGRY